MLDGGLLVLLTLGLQYQYVSRLEADDEVGPVLPDHAPVGIKDLESQVVMSSNCLESQ